MGFGIAGVPSSSASSTFGCANQPTSDDHRATEDLLLCKPLQSEACSLTSLHECNSPSGVRFKEHGEYESHPDTSCILAYSSNSDVGAF
jgi:hypothetical protein